MKKSYMVKTFKELNELITTGGYKLAQVYEDDGTLTKSKYEFINKHGDVIRLCPNFRWAYRYEVCARVTPRESYTAETWRGGYVLIPICGALQLMHRVVASTFIEKPEGKDWVNHIDGNKKHNDVDNLEWCTRQENMQHYYKYLKEN